MQIVRTIDELGPAVARLRAQGSVALVPTMGALHAGHVALIAEARRRAGAVVATIFVNPTQFAAGEDLDLYPRREAADAAMLEEAGCDLLWVPGVDDVYPRGFATSITVAGVADRWEGVSRPGHFTGVATVVARLLLSVRPDVALFGEKDFQQLAVIRRMVADLGLGATIVGVPTVREADGLALSSRNAYLSTDERTRAPALARTLADVRAAILGGVPTGDALDSGRAALAKVGFEPIDYFALVDAEALEPLSQATGMMRLIAAARLGTTRLIDNIAVEMESSPLG